MNNRKKELVEMLLNREFHEQDQEELLDILINEPIAIDIDKQEAAKESFGDKLADKISMVAGSWKFIIIMASFLIIWMSINLFFLSNKDAFDPYPFILLNLVLSCVSAFQAPVIMMSQNRASYKDMIRNKNDYRTDLKSELILEALHDDLKKVQENQEKLEKMIEELKNEK